MSATRPKPTSETSETIGNAFDSLVRGVGMLSLVGVIGAVVLLIVTFSAFSGGGQQAAQIAQAGKNIALYHDVLVIGVVIAILATSYLFWGEETLGPFQLLGAALLYFMPLYLPPMMGKSLDNPVAAAALQSVQLGGMIAGGLAGLVTLVDLVIRARTRIKQGAKADQIKYGKGVKEEADIKNVFMGKCWQLPYCRKFVRERCPIYHSRRTCWKERVGCMCEEEVIRNAMEGKVIPKNALASSQFIPRNSRLTPEQKAARCRQCVIYNEHQRHKYKLALPICVGSVLLVYALGREPLKGLLGSVIVGVDRAVGTATYRSGSQGAVTAADTVTLGFFKEILLICLLLMLLAYLMKLIEYLFFKIKV